MILHVTSQYPIRNDAERERLARAAATWTLPNMLKVNIVFSERTSNDIGSDEKTVPYVRDLIEDATRMLGPYGYVCLTNTDTCFALETNDLLEGFKGEAIYSNRYDIMRPVKRQISLEQAGQIGKQLHDGADLFLFTKQWWLEVRDSWPDLLMGFEGWDWVLKLLIGIDNKFEKPIVYHETHGTPYWLANRTSSKLNLWNRRLCKEWIERQPDPESIRELWPASREF